MTIEARIHGAVERMFEGYDEIVAAESFATRQEIENLAVSAIYGIAAFNTAEALKLLNENPTLMTEPLLLPEGDHFSKKSLTGQISYRVISKATTVIMPFVDVMLRKQFGEECDARENLLAAAELVFEEYCRLAVSDPKLSMIAQGADEYPSAKAEFDGDPEAFIELVDRFAAYIYLHHIDLARKRYVAAVEAWRLVCTSGLAEAA